MLKRYSLETWRVRAASLPGLLPLAVPGGCAEQCMATGGKDKVNWKGQLVLSSVAEPFKSLELAASASFIWVTMN